MISSENAADRWRKGIARWKQRIKENPDLSVWFRNQMLTLIGCNLEECPMWWKTGCLADHCVREVNGRR